MTTLFLLRYSSVLIARTITVTVMLSTMTAPITTPTMMAELRDSMYNTVGVKIKFPFGFCSTELKRYTVLTKNSYKTNKNL